MWNDLNIKEKSDLMKIYLSNGIRDINQMKEHYNSFENGGEKNNITTLPEVIVTYDQSAMDKASASNARFMQRIRDPKRQTIPDWEDPDISIATHKLSWATDNEGNGIVYPDVQEINGVLHDFTNPKYKHGKYDAYDNAIENNNYIIMTPEEAKWYTENYKKYNPFDNGGNLVLDVGYKDLLHPDPLDTLQKVNTSSTTRVVQPKIIIKHNNKNNNNKNNGNNNIIKTIPAKSYIVKSGDSPWRIATNNNLTLDELYSYNPGLEGKTIYPGDEIKLSKGKYTKMVDLSEEKEIENNLNKSNNYINIIQSAKHDDNYVIIDKKYHNLTIYDKNNTPLYTTNAISTGLSGNDYNTITYVDSNGNIRTNKGNMSTPAGITEISGKSNYHGYPAYTRKRMGTSKNDNIASSFHWGYVEEGDPNVSNGCVRISGQSLIDMEKYLKTGTKVYTLPEKSGSKFSIHNGTINYTAQNPFGETKGDKKYWDDYNVYIDKTYKPLVIDTGKNNNSTHDINKKKYADTISNVKQKIQKEFNLSSYEYNNIAELCMGIAEQESGFGTGKTYHIKEKAPLLVKSVKAIKGNTSSRSSGITQIKYGDDIKNKDLKALYDKYNITEQGLKNPEVAALATIIRVSYIYNTEIKGRTFKDKKKNTMDNFDALLYKYNGRHFILNNGEATPTENLYINNVKKYAKENKYYELRDYEF